ncbi:type II secretion system inner membrane protein GspF [Bdellovibrio bacteriovorus]|uniref:type II secretion system inner membrane protein GspF n=1 Tax=Bdellovibrio bacteriovorus TaxID=959 RepID=UPI0021CE5DC2|nr:type II secretion system inner membrane protein GspF [Bdellovibrio bacteriovorus]UXR63859.1 type II secretion system inner membrane protein GspF [Bdellovibrio bacteriovorus]
MPIFEYKGLSKDGRNVKGTIDAENQRAARTKLKKDNIFVIDIKDKKKIDPKKKSGPRTTKAVGVKDLSLMTRQLATLIKANIPLVDALTAVSEQVENPTLSEALADCKNMVNEGSTLHKAMLKYPNVFTTIYVSMVEAGEMSGSLDVILMRLAEFTEAQADLRAKVSSAMTYPIIMLVVTFGLMGFLFIFLIPKMVTVFESAPQLQLPWYTVALIDASQIAVNYWYLIIGSIMIIYLLFRNWKNTPAGKNQWDAISLKLPLVGPTVRMVAVSRFTRTLATLLNGGVPMLAALDIVRNVVDNHVLALAIDEARSNISEGESIAGPLKKSGQFPPIVIHMVNIGEKTGELENMLSQVSDAYDFQVKTKLEGLTSIMGPVVIVIMGAAIGMIVMAVMVPMFEMANVAG